MKKNILVYALICFLTVSGCKKKNESSVDNNLKSAISFEQLSTLATSLPYTTGNDYKIIKKEINLKDGIDYEFVNILGSELATYTTTEGENITYHLENVRNGNVIEPNVCYDVISFPYTNNVDSVNGVFYVKDTPIAFYAKATENPEMFSVCIIDSTGQRLKTVNAFGGSSFLTIEEFTFGESSYIEMKGLGTSSDLYFKYSFVSDDYKTELIDYSDYSKAFQEYRNSQGSSSGNTNAYYDRNGDVVAHIEKSNNKYYIYDKSYNYLNSFSLSSFTDSSFSKIAYLEKKICFFFNKEYYKEEANKGSEKAYKCDVLKVDLTTGTLSFDENLDYYVESCFNKTEDNHFKYSYIKYHELNEQKEKKSYLKCAFLTNELDFSNNFIDDGFTNTVYKLNDNELLAYFDNGLYAVTKTDRFSLDGIELSVFKEDGTMYYYSERQHCYYCCNVNDFISTVFREQDDGYENLSSSLFGGNYILYNNNKAKYDSRTYNINERVKGLSENGLLVVDNAIYVGLDKIIDFGDNTILDATLLSNCDATRFYKFSLMKSNPKYYKFDYVLVK